MPIVRNSGLTPRKFVLGYFYPGQVLPAGAMPFTCPEPVNGGAEIGDAAGDARQRADARGLRAGSSSSRRLLPPRAWITTPKNHQRRRVDMSQQLADTLAALNLRQRKRALEAGSPRSELVFPSVEGTLLDEANVRHLFYRILAKAQLRRIRFHDLRHTYLSLLIQQGESLAYVRDQMGHRSIQVTVDLYGHLVPGGNRAASTGCIWRRY
jgi:integrase